MGILVLAVYAAIIFFVSGRMALAGKTGSKEAFYINSRESSALGVAMSILVSCVGASATLGMIGMSFQLGTPAFWWLGMGCVGLTLLSLFLAKKVRASGAFTMPQMVEKYLGAPARPLISALIVVAWMAILAAQFNALTRIIASLTGLHDMLCLALSFMLIVLHTLGGQAAIMRIDRIQTATLIFALIVVLVWISGQNPGWITTTKIELVNEKFTLGTLMYYLFIVGSNYLVCPMLFGRFLSARDVSSARKGGIISVVLLGGCAVLIVAVGLACVGLVPADTEPDSVLTVALASFMPSWLHMLIGIALVSAIVSSADSCLITAATVLSHDLLRCSSLKTSRICVLLLGLGGLSISFWGKGILGYLLVSYSIYACGVVVPVFICMVFGEKRQIHPVLACVAVVIGGSFGFASGILEIDELSYFGMASSALLTILGLLVSRREYSTSSI